MRAGLVVAAVVAVVAVLGSGCVTGRELRVQAELHAPVIPEHENRKLEPGAGLMLVNPLVCFEAGGSCSGDGAPLCALFLIGCAGFLGAVDLVALPVQAVRHHGQLRDLEAIGVACPLDDPASRAASGLADRMVQELGFAPAPPAGPDAQARLARARTPDPVYVRVTTTRFERSSRIEWSARIAFVGTDEQVLWRTECADRAPVREARTFVEECESAREEVGALADRCVEMVTGDLRRRWPEWDPAKHPARQTGAEAGAGWDR